MKLILLHFALKYNGDWHKIFFALKSKELVPPSALKKLVEKIFRENIKFLSIIDENYPASFKVCDQPPFVLFYRGNLKLLYQPGRMLTGGFSPNSEAVRNAVQTARKIFRHYVLLTGFRSTLDNIVYDNIHCDTPVVFVSADNVYAPCATTNFTRFNLKDNLIVSECYANPGVSTGSLNGRNRLLVALTKALVLVTNPAEKHVAPLVHAALAHGTQVVALTNQASASRPPKKLKTDNTIHYVKNRTELLHHLARGE